MRGDIDAAIQNYTKAASSTTCKPFAFFDKREKKLLRLVLENPSHLPHGCKVFRDLVKLREETLDPRHPLPAFTMRRLAQLLVHQGRDLDQAQSLLKKALKILQPQTLAPPAVTEEITDLLAKVEEMQSQPASQPLPADQETVPEEMFRPVVDPRME
jgi:hypothetical protein